MSFLFNFFSYILGTNDILQTWISCNSITTIIGKNYNNYLVRTSLVIRQDYIYSISQNTAY